MALTLKTDGERHQVRTSDAFLIKKTTTLLHVVCLKVSLHYNQHVFSLKLTDLG